MTEREQLVNGEDHHDTIPVRRTTLDDILEGIHECRTGIASLRVRVDDIVDRFSSDIRALRGGHKEATESVADLEATLAKERVDEARASRDKWRNWVVGIGTSVLLVLIGALVGRALK